MTDQPITFGSSVNLPFAAGVLAWSPDSAKVVTAGSQGHVDWLSAEGPLGTVLVDAGSASADWHHEDPGATTAGAIAFAPDGATVAIAKGNGLFGQTLTVTTMPFGETLWEKPHDHPPQVLLFSPDSRLLASCDNYSTRVFEVATGTLRLEHANGVEMLVPAFTPDSHHIALMSRQDCVLVDTSTGTTRWTRTIGDQWTSVRRIAFHPDGTQLVLACLVIVSDTQRRDPGSLVVLSAQSGEVLSSVSCAEPIPVYFGSSPQMIHTSQDASWVAKVSRGFDVAGSSTGVAVWSVADGQQRFAMRPLPYLTDIYAVDGRPVVRFSPKGRFLAVSCGDDGSGVLVLDAENGVTVFTERLDPVLNLEFSPDGKWLAVASGRTVRFYAVTVPVDPVPVDPDAPSAVCDLGSPVKAISLTSGSLRMAGACAGKVASVIHASSGQLLYSREHPGELTAITFGRDGLSFATACADGGVRLFESVSGNRTGLWAHGAPVNTVAFAPDGNLVSATAAPDRAVRLLGVTAEDPLWRQQHPQGVGLIAVDPAGRWVATGCVDRVTRILAAATGVPQPFTVQGDSTIKALVFNGDGSLLVTGNADSSVILIDPASGEQRHRITHSGAVAAVAISTDGRLLAVGGEDLVVRVLDLSGGTPAQVAERALPAAVTALAFNPTTAHLTAVTEDGTVRILDPALVELRDHEHPELVSAIAYSDDGRLLATACEDGNARVYDGSVP